MMCDVLAVPGSTYYHSLQKTEYTGERENHVVPSSNSSQEKVMECKNLLNRYFSTSTINVNRAQISLFTL